MMEKIAKLLVAFLALLLAPSGMCAQEYLLVNGIDVSAGNSNITGDGKASYDVASSTLTLSDGASLESIVNNGVNYLNILINGNVTITPNGKDGILAKNNTTITGGSSPGHLTIHVADGYAGINFQASGQQLNIGNPLSGDKSIKISMDAQTNATPKAGLLEEQYFGKIEIGDWAELNINFPAAVVMEESYLGSIFVNDAEQTALYFSSNLNITPTGGSWDYTGQKDQREYYHGTYKINNSKINEFHTEIIAFNTANTTTPEFRYSIISKPNGNTPGTVSIDGFIATNTQNCDPFIPSEVTNGHTGLNYTVVGITSIENCTNLESITIPATVTSMGASAFQGCTNLETVNFSGSKPTVVGGIETEMFTGIAASPTLNVPKYDDSWSAIVNSKTWGGVSWGTVGYRNPEKIGQLVIRLDDDGNVVETGGRQFLIRANCYPSLCAEITTIQSYGSVGNNIKPTFTIPTSLSLSTDNYETYTEYTIKQVNEGTYTGNALKGITIPSGVLIEEGAFANIENLQTVTFADGCEQNDYGNIFSNITSGNDYEASYLPPVQLMFPEGWTPTAGWAGGNWRWVESNQFTVSAVFPTRRQYQSGSWSNGGIESLDLIYTILDENTVALGSASWGSAFFTDHDPSKYKEVQVEIPNTVTYDNTEYTVTKILSNAFHDTDWIYSVKMPSSLTEIEDNAFVNMDNLFKVDFSVVSNSFDRDAVDNGIKFRNISYGEDKVKISKPDSWTIYEDWGAGGVAIWGTNATPIEHYGIFIDDDDVDDVEITNKNNDWFKTNKNIYVNIDGTLQISDDATFNSIRVETPDNNDEALCINIGENKTLTLNEGLIVNRDVIIESATQDVVSNIVVNSSNGASVQIAANKSLTFGDETNESQGQAIVTINNTGGAPCISGGEGSGLTIYKSNVIMTTNGSVVISGISEDNLTLNTCRITEGAYNKASLTITLELIENDQFAKEFTYGGKTIEFTFEVIDATNHIASIYRCSNPNDKTEVDIVIPSTVTGPDNVTYSITTILSYAFQDVNYDYITFIKSITIPSSITSIENDAFCMLANLQSVTFQDGVLRSCVNMAAFSDITSGDACDTDPVELIIPASWGKVTPTWAGGNWTGGNVDPDAIVEGSTFTEDVNIIAVEEGDVAGKLTLNYIITKVPNGEEKGEVAIYKEDDLFGINVIGNGILAYSLPEGESENTKGTLVIPAYVGQNDEYKVTAIGANAFYALDLLTNEEISCPYINSITFPETLTSIYFMAFPSCPLTSITFKGDRVPDRINGDGSMECIAFNMVTASLTVPASWGLVADDWNTGTWTSINYQKEVELDEEGNAVETTPVNFAVDNPDEQTMSVSGSEELTEEGTVVIPATVTLGTDDFTVTAIGDNAFEGQTNLTGVTLPQTLTSIGAKAFKDCGAVSEVTFLGAVPTISDDAFSGTTVAKVNYPAAAKSTTTDTKLAAVEAATTSPCVFTSTEWTTLYSGMDFTLPDGVEAYIVTNVDFTTGKLTVAPTDGKVKANTALLLRKQPAGNDMYPITSFADVDISGAGSPCDEFKGNTEPVAITNTATTQYYILVNGQFVKATDGTLPAYKCYILSEQTSGAPALSIEIQDGETTGVGDVRGKKDDVRGEWYDLSGRKLQGKPTQKGMYIINGKKVNVK